MAYSNHQRKRRVLLSGEVAHRLRVAREAHYLTQYVVAEKLGISRGRWSMYESGRRPIDWVSMLDFCKLTNVDLDYLLKGDTGRLDPELRSRIRKAAKSLGAPDPDNGAGG